MLNHFLEQFKGTLYRQTMFAEFELRIGQLAAQGETLTADLLSREYRALNEDYFGPDMVIDDEIALEWARIPHFYYNYYVFQYATGYSAAIALSRRILKEGAPAVKDYLGFLSGGCSQDPIDLLRGAGVDMASPQPIPGRSGPVRPASGRNGGADLSGLTSTRETKTPPSPYAWAAYGEARFGLM